jgi:hypothetical protein
VFNVIRNSNADFARMKMYLFSCMNLIRINYCRVFVTKGRKLITKLGHVEIFVFVEALSKTCQFLLFVIFLTVYSLIIH